MKTTMNIQKLEIFQQTYHPDCEPPLASAQMSLMLSYHTEEKRVLCTA